MLTKNSIYARIFWYLLGVTVSLVSLHLHNSTLLTIALGMFAGVSIGHAFLHEDADGKLVFPRLEGIGILIVTLFFNIIAHIAVVIDPGKDAASFVVEYDWTFRVALEVCCLAFYAATVRYLHYQYRNQWLYDSLRSRYLLDGKESNIDYTAAFNDSFEWDIEKLVQKHERS